MAQIILNRDYSHAVLVLNGDTVVLPDLAELSNQWQVTIKRAGSGNVPIVPANNTQKLFLLAEVTSHILATDGSWVTLFAAPQANKFYGVGSFSSGGDTDLQQLQQIISSLQNQLQVQSQTITALSQGLAQTNTDVAALVIDQGVSPPITIVDGNSLPTRIIGNTDALLGKPVGYQLVKGKKTPYYE